MSLTLNNVRCVRARAVIRWRGVWTVDADLDPDSSPVTEADVPVGSATLSVTTGNGSTFTMVGTVNPKAAGRWVSGVPLQLVAGGGGWDQVVAPQDFQNPNGVSALAVEQHTASLVGETINDPQPISMGLHWSRTAGPASRVFSAPDRDWYVDLAGVTQVGTWPAAAADPSVTILEWDPLQQKATMSADAVVLPGTVLTDPRFDGPITVRDVELVFDKDGTHITAWCSDVAISRFTSALANLVRELGALSSLKSYQYRIVSQNGALLSLQAVNKPDGTPSDAPDSTNVIVWPGMQGLSGVYKVSSLCRIIFLEANFGNPVVVSFDGSKPTEVTLNATSIVHVGPDGTVQLAENASDYADAPVARVGDSVAIILPPECPLSGEINGIPIPPGTLFLTVAFPLPGTIMSGASKALA